ncbi:MAG: ABC transporter ATP-binding protein [Clostridiales bacterium]|nr:ABC transporter ATP-binding protein [Clostridiales bacterium]
MSVTLENVSKRFEERQVISHLSLTLPDSGAVCFFGPSGCGKTTLLRLICGLDTPDIGAIQRSPGLRFACHFQEDRLLPWYTVEENLALTMPEKDIPQGLRDIGLHDIAGLYPDELSGGMRRRVSLLRALKHPSDVLVLDEPLRELDEDTANKMLELIRKNIGDRLLILVTHDVTQAEKLGCEVLRFPLGQ